jgi:hypothetical protein
MRVSLYKYEHIEAPVREVRKLPALIQKVLIFRTFKNIQHDTITLMSEGECLK